MDKEMCYEFKEYTDHGLTEKDQWELSFETKDGDVYFIVPFLIVGNKKKAIENELHNSRFKKTNCKIKDITVPKHILQYFICWRRKSKHKTLKDL